MKKYQELENKIQELQAEVERLKQEEKAEQIDLSTCIVGQLVQLRNGQFALFGGKNTGNLKNHYPYLIDKSTYTKKGEYCIGDDSPYDVVKVFPAEIPVPGRFNVFYTKKVLKGDISCLGNSFNFADTPQGVQYWRDIVTGKTNLSFGDMIFIQKWVIQTQS